jgi:cytochrome c oxidase subunit IV
MWTTGGTLAAVFLVYCGVYIVTPSDLAWHLGTSLSRLYAQLWPAFLVLVFLALRTAEETASTRLRSTPGRKAAARPV